MNAIIYQKPDRRSPKIGYLRAGGTVVRGEKPVALDDCQGGYYRVLPAGCVCASDEATTDLKHPILRALTRRPDLSKPMPYPYAFVRAIAPNYYRAPSMKEQLQYEMSLKSHLKSYSEAQEEVGRDHRRRQRRALDEKGNAIGEAPAEAPERTDNEIYGGTGTTRSPGFSRAAARSPTSRPSRRRTTRSSPTASLATRASR